MVQLLQLNGELPERFPGHERRLYVLTCRKQSCRRKPGSLRALRGVRVSKDAPIVSTKSQPKNQTPAPEKQDEKAPTKVLGGGPSLGETLFGAKPMGASLGANPFASNANPFSTSTASPSANPFSSSSSKSLTSSSTTDPFSTLPKMIDASLHISDPKTVVCTLPSPRDTQQDAPKTFAQVVVPEDSRTRASPAPAPEPWPAEKDMPKPYPILYLADADYETLDPTPLTIPNTARMDVDDSSASGSGFGIDKDVFESSMDAVFQKFADRLAQNPEQVIRYEFAGQPLLYSKDDAVGKLFAGAGDKTSGPGIPNCSSCRAKRVFEVQLTPHAITELEAEELGLEGMDWGTVIIGVCEADCSTGGAAVGDEKYLEEWVGVQWEETVKH
jgi:pre-rRNA-processing protein TSR4